MRTGQYFPLCGFFQCKLCLWPLSCLLLHIPAAVVSTTPGGQVQPDPLFASSERRQRLPHPPPERTPAELQGQVVTVVLPHTAPRQVTELSVHHLLPVLGEKQAYFCTVLLSKSLPGASLRVLPDSSTAHPPHTVHTGLGTDTGAACSQGSSYRVGVVFSLGPYEIDIIILLVVQNFFLVLSLVV